MSPLPMFFTNVASPTSMMKSTGGLAKQPRGAAAPRATRSATAATPERERPAGTPLKPVMHLPSAQPSASAEKPRRGRRPRAVLQPTKRLGADQPSAPPATATRADEAYSSVKPNETVPRRHQSRSVKADASPPPAIDAVEPSSCLPGAAPFPDDAAPTRKGRERVSRGGQQLSATRRGPVAAGPITDPASQHAAEPLWICAAGPAAAPHLAPSEVAGRAATIVAIAEHYRVRMRWMKSENKLVTAAQAALLDSTGGNWDAAKALYSAIREDASKATTLQAFTLAPYLDTIATLERHSAQLDRVLAKLARELPVYPWVKATYGLSDKALAIIVGEAGDLRNYANPGKLWKRLGLAPYQGKPGAYWRKKGGLTEEQWAECGYNPSRRSRIWNIGNNVVGFPHGVRPLVGEDWQARTDWSPYQKVFVGRLIRLAEQDPEQYARPPAATGKMSFSKAAAAKAKYVAEKALIKDLWLAWWAADGVVAPGKPYEPPMLMAAE